MKRTHVLAVGAYCAIGFLTFGYLWNRGGGVLEAGAVGTYAGIFWPIYWAGRAGIALTQGWTF